MLRRSVLAVVVTLLIVVGAVLLFTYGGLRRTARPNIVLIVLDTVREDETGVKLGAADRHSATPTLDRLALEGTVFTSAWANGPWTVPSHASLFTGLLPSGHGCTSHHARLEPDVPTLAELMSEDGYETVAFFSNPWLTDRLTGVMRGFETKYVSGAPGLQILYRSDQGGQDTVRKVSDWLRKRRDRRPFFMFVNILEAHLPYDPPLAYRRAYLADLEPDDVVSLKWSHEFNAGLHDPDLVDWNRVRRLYAGDTFNADGLLGEILHHLREDGVYDGTVIIVTSDHGENLGEHGLVGHQFCVYETLLRVPLIIVATDVLPQGFRSDPAMLTDIFPTVLELAGIDGPSLAPHARSLLSEADDQGRPVIAEYAGGEPALVRHMRTLNPGLDTTPLEPAYITVRSRDLRLTLGSDGSEALHDLATDPGQERNLASERRGDVETLRRLLPAVRDYRGEPVEIDEDMRAWLRSLGYIR